ncbi:hypothetical protein C5Y97_30440 [Blastopirellula marina]|uniref:AAA domain-containing protein n=1 Tax=Blastopirellula marina TaxID=124 RepID=A0A2S8F2S2_9BACT|nr:hypothetical protein C5Y98_30425 [Blastopirellula marina]PTL40769.1 hypothetical protein C5Y97_30440 [Blastopirellula marina]
MNAILLGPSNVAQTLEAILVQRGIRVVKSASASLQEARQEFLLMQDAMDLICVIADSDTNSTRSTLQGLRLLTDRPIILFGVVSQPADIMRFIRAGASDYINVASDFAAELDEIISHMRGQTARIDQRGLTTAFCAASGGVGATTLAVNCATLLAGSGARVCLVDLNLCGGDAALHLGLQPETNLMHCSTNPDDIHAITVNKLLTRHESGLNLLAAPQFLDEQSVLSPEVVHRLIGVLSATHDYVLIDMEDVFHREQLAAMSLTDRMFLTFRIEFPSLVRTRRTLDYFAANQLDNITLCANRMPTGSGISKERAESVLRRSIDYLIPEETRQATDAINVGVPVVLEYPRAKLAKTCVQISEELQRSLKQRAENSHVSEPVT